MEALARASSSSSSSVSCILNHLLPTPSNITLIHTRTQIYQTPFFNHASIGRPISSIPQNRSKFQKIYTTVSADFLADPTEQDIKIANPDEKFDWFSQWYPVMPVADLDKRAPHGKKVMGLEVVVWWDKNENEWKVFDDCCPHRLAPLSEGRIDQWGRLQCVYHGWCFGGAGDCKFIPQAPRDGPPIHTSHKACVAVYPSTVQNGIVWFWPSTDPKNKGILVEKKPPYIPELDDPSYTKSMGSRDLPYGYEILTENFMDPAHVPYAHYKIMGVRQRKNSEKVDREGGKPLEISIKKQDINGYSAEQEIGGFNFVAPCVFHGYATVGGNKADESASSGRTKEELASRVAQRRILLIFITVPVSPGHSRLIWSFPRNFGIWIDQIVPRWIFHIGQNLILDSDLYLLHVEERKILELGPSNWHKSCFVPTKADTLVVAFRRWLKKHSGGQIDWGKRFSGALLPTPPREQLLDRYWSHVVNCRSCSAAYKALNAVEVTLQIISIASVGIVAVAKQGMLSAMKRNSLLAMAVLCFIASKMLSHFIYKNFHFHDYNHALV